jgi:hypothetical protein
MCGVTRQRFIGAILWLTTLAACVAPNPGPEPPVTDHTYTASTADFPNPERGMYSPFDLPNESDASVIRTALGNTLVHSYVRLDEWRETDLPQSFLDELDASFAAIRQSGVKVILRFAYNFGPYPDSEPDASKAQMLRHIEQLKPVLQKNADVIAWMRAGFVGAWGEWHTSTHGIDRDLGAKREVLTALLAALPASRSVQLRYPADIWQLYGDPLAEAEAFTGSDKARVGHHNDCFLSSDTDVGTYERNGTNTRAEDEARLAVMSRFTPVGGETCAPYPPLSDCESTLREMARLHFTEINQSYHPRIVSGWKRQGCLDEIRRRLGYRLALQTASFNEQVRPGGVMRLNITLTNTGFAAPVNPRPLNVVLDGPGRFVVTLGEVEVRRWEPGPASFAVSLRVPASAPAGEYRLALWLPDAAETLRDDPRYAVRFANEEVWDEASGFNVLSAAIKIDPSVTGASDPNAVAFSVLSQ